jgi:hypothetical protein
MIISIDLFLNDIAFFSNKKGKVKFKQKCVQSIKMAEPRVVFLLLFLEQLGLQVKQNDQSVCTSKKFSKTK